jgi:uncharacterized protein (TIGR03382 family)
VSARWAAIALLVVAAVLSGVGAETHSRYPTGIAWAFFAVAAIVILRARRR